MASIEGKKALSGKHSASTDRQSHGYCLRLLYFVFVTAALASAAWTANMMASTLFRGINIPGEGDPTEALASNVKERKGLSGSLKSFISGGFGGMCVVLVGHPLDLIKVRMQTTQSTNVSMVRVITHTFRESGIRGMYRGVSAPLFAAAFVFAVSFWGYDVSQQLIRYFTNHMDLTIFERCLAGGLSGIPSSLLMAPSERIKILMQTEPKYTNMFRCGLDIIRKGGVRSLFRGLLLTLARDIPGSMIWFGTYEYIKYIAMIHLALSSTSQLPSIVVVVAGGLAGMMCWTISNPADVLKSRLQSAPDGTYSGIRDVFQEVVHTDGASALLKGLVPSLIRAFPANAACFYGMEVMKECLDYVETIMFA